MTKEYVLENGKIYEVQKIEVTVADIEFHIAQANTLKTELELELIAMNAAK